MSIIHIYTGNGGGKTAAALGIALRALGHGEKAVIIQFMKGWKNTGEYLIKKKLGKNYQIYQFGRKDFVNLKNPLQADIKLAEKGLEFAKKILKKKPKLLILDEINIAATAGLVKVNDVLKLLGSVPERTTVYLTGRYAPAKFVRRADFVTKIEDIKRPKKSVTRKGIDF